LKQQLSSGFIALLAMAVIVAACGRQVTPNPPGLGAGGAPPGYVAIFFSVQSPFNFSNYQYMVVFNTSGDGVTPSTDTVQTNWAGYKDALIALGNGGASSAEYVQFISPKTGKGPPTWFTPHTTPQQLSYNANANGSGTQFSMLVLKSILKPYASPSPSPSASPSNVWTFNAFTTAPGGSQGNWYFEDSLGRGGPIDPQFVSPRLCMTEPFDNTYYAQATTSDPSDQIYTLELANNPVTPTACP
jgi:hypothetical protein